MSDNLAKKQPQDAQRVNLHEEWELRYWCQKWNVTPDQLKAAVMAVGVMSKDVARQLGKA